MAESPIELRTLAHPENDTPAELNLGFTLSFIGGRGLLTGRDKKVGPFELKVLELEIPDIEFPFDVTGGSERFKNRRCHLRHLAVSLDSDGLSRAFDQPSVKRGGFAEIRSAIRDGYIQLGGRFAAGEHVADFTMRLAPLIHSPRELSLIFYDTRVYGWLPVPAALLPVYLHEALEIPFIRSDKAGAWTLTPADDFLRALLPRAGWKVPDTRRAALSMAHSIRGRLVLAAGVAAGKSANIDPEREPPRDAIMAGEGVSAFVGAEQLLAQGQIADAFQRYREALDDERGGRWARERLLQIGAADPELTIETRQLGEECIASDPADVQALLALAAIAVREHAWGEAATRYAALAEIAQGQNLRYDVVAAELAGAAAVAPIDPGAALAGYERAAARARDSIVAHRALFDIQVLNQDWDGAAKTGARLSRLVQDPATAAEIHRELGVMHRVHRNDLNRARACFQKALKIQPNDPAALEGLAETFAARGEPARAATCLARLAEHAEASEDAARIVSLNLRLGEIWEGWLGDEENASRRYHRVLDIDRRNRTAQLRLATLAEKKQNWNQARALYEDLLAAEDDRGDPDATPDLVLAYTRLAQVTLSTEGATAGAIACLERAVELDPTSRVARTELAQVMRDRGEWHRLASLLEESARYSDRPPDVRRARIEAARLHLSQLGDPAATRRHLEAILDANADDQEALSLLVPLLLEAAETDQIVSRLQQAADSAREPVRRGDYLFRLASLRDPLDLSEESQRQILESALQANPYLLNAAEQLVELLQDSHDYERRVSALARWAVAADDPKTRANALVQHANILWQHLGRVDMAEASLRSALRWVPDDFAAWNQLSRVYESVGNAASAKSALQTALAKAKKRGVRTAPLYERLAELARAQEDYEEEVDALSAALAAGLRTEKIAQRLIRVLSQLERGHEAAELLESWASEERNEDNERLAYLAAELRRSLGDHERASDVFALLIRQGGSAAAASARSLERLAFERGDAPRERLALEFLASQSSGEEKIAACERLADSLLRQRDMQALERLCRELLELDAQSSIAHRCLGLRLETLENFNEALSHYETLIFDTPRDRLDRNTRRDVFVHTAGLAHEFHPNLLPRLKDAFDAEFPEAPDDALDRPLSVILDDERRWEELFRLRHSQIEWVGEEKRSAYEADLAHLLHHRLNRPEEAIPYYQSVIASSQAPDGARDALIDVFERLGRWGDLASHLFALSQLSSERNRVIHYGLRSARLYGDELGDWTAAQQVLRTLLVDPEVDWRYGGLTDALRDFGLDSELALLTEKSLEFEPAVDDGRLEELVALLSDTLNGPERAFRWTTELTEKFPGVDDGWRLHSQLLRAHPAVGNLKSWMELWASVREGSAKAAVLRELAQAHHDDREFEREVQVLEQTAQAEKGHIETLERLVERLVALGRWDETLPWLEQLANITPEPDVRDMRLRRWVEVAADYADRPDLAIRGLESLSAPTEGERSHLLQLYIETGNVNGMEARQAEIQSALFPLQVAAARSAFGSGARSLAQRFFSWALENGNEQEIWSEVTDLWTVSGHLEELGRWRLERADALNRSASDAMRLLAYAELLESSTFQFEGLSDAVASADLSDLEVAWAVYRLGQVTQTREWQTAAVPRLLNDLAETDPRLRSVLLFRAELELEGGDPDRAVDLARRLLEMGEPRATHLLVSALERAERTSELITVLEERALTAEDEETKGELWFRLAELRYQSQDVAKAVDAIGQVPESARAAPWADLARRLAREVKEHELRIIADCVSARIAPNDAERAYWLRSAARFALWGLHDEDRGHRWLREAHALDPKSAEETVATFDGLQPDQIQARLAEAFVVLEGAAAIPLWLYKFEQGRKDGDLRTATDSLDAMARCVEPGDSRTWVRLSEYAAELGDAGRRRDFLARGYSEDRGLEEVYLAAVSAVDPPERLVEILSARAGELDGQESAVRLARAADIALEQMSDPEFSLDLLERSLHASRAPDILRRALILAMELGRLSTLAEFGGALLEHLERESEERSGLLRRYVDALIETHSTADLEPPLRELVELGLATPQDRKRLAELVETNDARFAAELYEQAALVQGESDTDSDSPALLVSTAVRWIELDERLRAASLIEEAIARGADDIKVHALGLDVLSGDARMRSLRRTFELDGDAQWPNERRLLDRVEVARWHLERGEADHALAFAQMARQFGETDAWFDLMEHIWTARGDENQLAALRLNAIASGVKSWDFNGRVERLRATVEYYHQQEDGASEYQALVLLCRELPDDASLRDRLMATVADLGDRDTFVAQIESQWERSESPMARAELALRYANVLTERFESPDSATAFLHRAYMEGASFELAEASLVVGRAGHQLAAVHEWLLEGAAGVASELERTQLQVLLAEVAHEQLGERELAAGLYRTVFDRDPSHQAAREFTLEHLEQDENWNALVDAYERVGHALEGIDAKAAYLHASTLIDSHLDDPRRALSLAEAALEIDEEDRRLAAHVARKHIDLGNLQQARVLVEHKGVDPNEEFELLIRIIEGLKLTGKLEEVETLRATLAEWYPTSAEAGVVRLERAREREDSRALLVEIEKRLSTVRDLGAHEWLALHQEAGEASILLGDHANALSHFVASLDTPEPSPGSVLRAAEVASELGDRDRLDHILQVAGGLREQITTAALKTEGNLRVRWFTLLGQAHEKADDELAAIGAFEQALSLAEGDNERPLNSLLRLYENKSDWAAMVRLLEARAAGTDDLAGRARIWSRVARIHFELSGDEVAGEEALNRAIELEPDSAEAKLALGTLLMKRQEYGRAVELLEGQVNVNDPHIDTDVLGGYFVGLRELDRVAEAIEVSARILEREPHRTPLHLERAKLLEEAERLDESDEAWAAYLDALGPTPDIDLVLPALARLAQGATRRGDHTTAIEYLERALEFDPGQIELLRELREAVAATGDHRRVAALYEREADFGDRSDAIGLLKSAAEELRQTDDEAELFRVLRQVQEIETQVSLLEELVALALKLGEQEEFFALAMQLEAEVGVKALNEETLRHLGTLAERDDVARATAVYQELYSRTPSDHELAEKLRSLALTVGDYEVFLPLEEVAITRLENDEEKVERLGVLADIALRELKRSVAAAELIKTALSLKPDDEELRRRLADTYALDARTYAQATDIYRSLLESAPFDIALLRILARLHGQTGNTDRAFGYYAALKTLMPSDDEANRFVEACRQAMPTAPPRLVSDTDRGRGMVHPKQLGPVEELFAPLARFAELTQPGDLRTRGVDERDLLAANDPDTQNLTRALESIGLSNAELYSWRGGGFAVEVELVGKAAILLGTMLLSDSSSRQRAFLVVRAGELYRTGHTLCERFSATQLEALTSALAMAVAPDMNIPGATTQSQEWVKVISGPMTPQIQAQLAPRVQQYVSRFGEIDMASWRRACLSTAARTAMLVCCDIEDAISAMLRLRGFDDATDEQRPLVIQESPEELDLWKFALSDAYFDLRASLGIALRSG